MASENPRLTTIFLARHGQSESNHQSLITGQLDAGLSARGREQSEALAHCLTGESIAAIYTSALRRTVDTAQPTAAAKQLPIVSLPELNEIHLGVLQGRYRDERDPQAQALWAQWQADLWNFRVPGGETFEELAHRAGQALDELLRRHCGQSLLIVGHRATNRVLLGMLLGWPRKRWAEIRLRNKFFYAVRPGAPPDVTTIALSGSKAGVRQAGLIM
jgi:broad specificity phosphatase PhoE